jgi:HK97 family phage portal protein
VRLFGFEITRKKQIGALSEPSTRGGWFSVIRESFSGAWQRNIELRNDDILTFSAVFACVTLIASDIAKMPLRLVQQDAEGVWQEAESPAFSPVLRKPNHFQTRIDFMQSWLFSLLIHGNAYVLKERDNRGVVVALYVLDPLRTRPMVAANGDVYYSVSQDALAGVESTDIIVPAKELIHDRINTLYHPLVGISPLSAASLPATQGLSIQNSQSSFAANGSNPGGILTVPGTLSEEEVITLQRKWEENYSGQNYGRVAVLGGDLKYQPIGMVNANDSQLIEQLRLSAEHVCMAFKVPAYMINAGQPPNYNNIEALNQQYYSQCLQVLAESIELRLDEGLELPKPYGTEFDIDSLLRMDTASRMAAAEKFVGSGAGSPNEARKRFFDLGPVAGGETPYLQQQNYSLEALAKRDAQADPFATNTPAPSPTPTSTPEPDDDGERAAVAFRVKCLELGVS